MPNNGNLPPLTSDTSIALEMIIQDHSPEIQEDLDFPPPKKVSFHSEEISRLMRLLEKQPIGDFYDIYSKLKKEIE
ncbi:MAG TPA: hypothetical protein VIY47_06580 [Ignavibacteriaceae bacterium]